MPQIKRLLQFLASKGSLGTSTTSTILRPLSFSSFTGPPCEESRPLSILSLFPIISTWFIWFLVTYNSNTACFLLLLFICMLHFLWWGKLFNWRHLFYNLATSPPPYPPPLPTAPPPVIGMVPCLAYLSSSCPGVFIIDTWWASLEVFVPSPDHRNWLSECWGGSPEWVWPAALAK